MQSAKSLMKNSSHFDEFKDYVSNWFYGVVTTAATSRYKCDTEQETVRNEFSVCCRHLDSWESIEPIRSRERYIYF